jgi:hypothetical protein
MSLDVLKRDICALNKHFIDVIARHQDHPEQLSLGLNVSHGFLTAIAQMSSSSLAKAAELDQFLLQPVVDASTLREATDLPLDQGRAHLRSASRIKHVPIR